MNERNMLLINGSPRKKGTSHSFLLTLQALAQEKGMEAEIIHAIDFFDGRADLHILKPVIHQSDNLCLSAPLYFDGLPYPAIWLLEQLHDRFKNELQGKSFFALSQGGFPDATLQQPSLKQCRIFAIQAGMVWRGGLGHGGGAIIDGKPLNELGKKGVKMTSALGMALDAILAGNAIPPEAQKQIQIKIPTLMNPLLAAYLNGNTRKTAKKLGVDFACKPYLEKE